MLVGSGLILTAAHCLDYDSDTGAGITLGDSPVVEIETADGTKLKTTPWVIESVCDVALLGPLDSQAFSKQVRALEGFCRRTKSVPIFRGVVSERPLPVLIRSHQKKWIKGDVTLLGSSAHRVELEAEEQIVGGTSGGPIVTHDGTLVGIVSHCTEAPQGDVCEGLIPMAHLTLPVWASDLISKPRFEGYED